MLFCRGMSRISPCGGRIRTLHGKSRGLSGYKRTGSYQFSDRDSDSEL